MEERKDDSEDDQSPRSVEEEDKKCALDPLLTVYIKQENQDDPTAIYQEEQTDIKIEKQVLIRSNNTEPENNARAGNFTSAIRTAYSKLILSNDVATARKQQQDQDDTIAVKREDEANIKIEEHEVSTESDVKLKHSESDISENAGNFLSAIKSAYTKLITCTDDVPTQELDCAEKQQLQTQEKQFKCDFCNKSYLSRSSIRRHRHMHKGYKPHICEICNKPFSDKSDLMKHQTVHTKIKAYKCDTCDKCFAQKAHLIRHQNIHIGKKAFECSVCSKCFPGKRYLLRHLDIHTGFKAFKCDTCNESYASKEGLQAHIYLHMGLEPYKCDSCDRRFAWKSTLYRHRKLHTGYKAFKCDICNKCFSHKSHLAEHINTHSVCRSFKCNICNRVFSYERTLNKHLNVHNGL